MANLALLYGQCEKRDQAAATPLNHRSKLRRVTVLRSLGSLAIAGPLVAFALRAAARAGDAIEPAVCTLTPAETGGPFFVDRQLERSDLRIDPSDGSRKPGVPLRLAIVVTRTTPQGCTPLAGASVDLWHADAFGTYSGRTAARTSVAAVERVSRRTGRDSAARVSCSR